METIRLTSTDSQGDAGCSCTYTDCSATLCCSQHLFLHTNQTKSSPSFIQEVLGSLDKAVLLLRGTVISAGRSCSETSSPPFALTPAPPVPDLHHRPSLWNISPSLATNTPGLVILSEHQELSTAALPHKPQGDLPQAQPHWGGTANKPPGRGNNHRGELLPHRQPSSMEDTPPATTPPAAGSSQSLSFSF